MAEEKNVNLDPTPIFEKFVSDNEELLQKLSKDDEFLQWYEAFKHNEEINRSLGLDFLGSVIQDETFPGEESDGEYTYLNNMMQAPLSARVLRNAGRTEAARLIKNTRRLQLTEFARPSNNDREKGFRIVFEDDAYKPTELEKQSVKEFTHKIIEKFFYPPYFTIPSFSRFLGVCYDDFFDMDDITIEIRRSYKGTPLGFHTVDPTLVHHTIPKNSKRYARWDKRDGYNEALRKKRGLLLEDSEYKYLVIKNAKRIAALKESRMIKSHFFVTTEFERAFRGFSIVEQGIRMLMNIMKSLTYNASNFDNNRTPMGAFIFTGGSANRMVTEHFKRILYSYLSGAANRYRMPVLGLPEKGDAKFVHFGANSREMEFHLWMTLLHTILCQLSGTNPEEVSMSSHESAMTGKKLFDQAPDGVLQVSRDKGLNTFLWYMEDILNSTKVFKQMTGYNVKCKFIGLEVPDERVKIELQKSQLGATKSYNDIIRENGGEEQILKYGELNIYDLKAPESGVIQKVLDAKIQKEQQEMQMRQEEEAQQAEIQQSETQEVENANDNNLTENDRGLISKYGSPVSE